MIFFSKDAEESFDKLLYYPYTIGKHLQKTISDVNNITSALSSLPIVTTGVMTRRVIPNIGTITYLSTPTSCFIQYISWSTTLTRFYHVKSNFITFNSQGNIASVHPALYTDRNEPSFVCDNGFKVVSRYATIRGKRTEVFNFKDLNGHIICDIDFTQVKPFDEYKDMTARGYTPNRRCYMIFEDGYKEEIDENKGIRLESIINECVNRCLKKYLKENELNAKYLYHATPSCYVSSIKKFGLGGKIPKTRFWNYEGTQYEKITHGVFLATDEYVAESYVETSEYFEELADTFEEKYDKELEIVVFKVNICDLDKNLLSIDSNQQITDDTDTTYFYSGTIPYSKLTKVELYK